MKTKFLMTTLLALFVFGSVFAMETGNGKIVVAKLENGQVKMAVTPKLRQAIAQDLPGYQIKKIHVVKVGNPGTRFLEVQATGNGSSLSVRFQIVRSGTDLTLGLSGVTAGQTCSGDPCEVCAFRDSGWGCQCNDGGSDSYCKHTINSATDFNEVQKLFQ